MVLEEDSKHIPNFALVPSPLSQRGMKNAILHTGLPVRSPKQFRHTWNRSGLVRIGLDPDSSIMPHTQEIVDDLESLVTSRKIHCRNVHHRLELALGVISEEAHDWDNTRGSSV
jgi:hypothetical protein